MDSKENAKNGKTKYPSEHEEQSNFVSWFRKKYPEVLIFAIPNGGKRGIREATRLKCEGVVAGIPDLMIPEWKVFIEMKRIGGNLSAQQKEINRRLRIIDYRVFVCFGCNHAIDEIKLLTGDYED
jgi:hypothetical protein